MLQTFTAKLTRKDLVTSEIYILELDLGAHELEFVAGQYIILHVPQEGGDFLRRLYSISSPPQDKTKLELVLKRIPNGKATEYIDTIEVGADVVFDAPAGVFILRPTGRDLIFLATNTGITPFRSMILDEVNKGPLKRDIHVYWGMKYKADLYYYDEFVALAKREPRFHYTVCLSRDKEPHPSTVPLRIDFAITGEVLPKFDRVSHDYYICGGIKVIDILHDLLMQGDIQKEHIYFEKFT